MYLNLLEFQIPIIILIIMMWPIFMNTIPNIFVNRFFFLSYLTYIQKKAIIRTISYFVYGIVSFLSVTLITPVSLANVFLINQKLTLLDLVFTNVLEFVFLFLSSISVIFITLRIVMFSLLGGKFNVDFQGTWMETYLSPCLLP